MSIGDNIRNLRTRERLSQADFAKKLQVTKETVSRWESGRTFIRKAHLEQLVEIFGITVDDILSEEFGLGSTPPIENTASNAASIPDSFQPLLFPVYKIERSGNGTALRHVDRAFAPPDVAQRHPASIFVRMDYREMTRLYPVGSLLLVDQRAQPYNGCTTVALVDNATVVIRRYLTGNDTVVLSSWSYDAPSPDLMLDKRRIRIIGVVVWFQASHDSHA